MSSKFADQPLGKLLFSMALPAIIANLVNSLYNIVDQIFIGHGVGYLGNAATNIAFPLTTVCLAIGLMTGIGGATNFNLALGAGDKSRAKKAIVNALVMSAGLGLIIMLLILLNLKALLQLFGATATIFDYAYQYTIITAFGLPLVMLTLTMTALIRAEGSSTYAMTAVIIGAGLNTILDPILIFAFDLGIQGAAWATLISQLVACLFLLYYFRNFKTFALKWSDFRPDKTMMAKIFALGSSAFIFQSSMMLIQVVTNNLLKHYGATSPYGSDIALAVAGIVLKINAIFIAIIIGLVQGAQPILGFNYGAQNFKRVKATSLLVIKVATGISLMTFTIFQLFPQELLSIFGQGSSAYFQFGEHFIHIYFGLIFISGAQIASANFFQAIGKARTGVFLSLLRQVILLLPLLFLMSGLLGVEGIAYATPMADALAALTAFYLLYREFKHLNEI